ncbi:MAG: 30S ribosomal protein S9, partial [Patescibacteria group bacterium]
GRVGQLGATILGIARTIEKMNSEKYRPALKKAGLLTRDDRTRERRKVGTGGKARRKKQSPKR